MPRFIAFLRAVNVGGRTVKMDHLRQLFESLGLVNVETFIASGNVIFELPRGRAKSSASLGAEMAETVLERKIEGALREALGYDVTTFLRTSATLAEVARRQPFDTRALAEMTALNVAFLGSVPDAAAVRRLLALQTGIDDFHVHDREVYWLCRKKQSESTFSGAVLERTIGQRATVRGVNTVRKLAEKYRQA